MELPRNIARRIKRILTGAPEHPLSVAKGVIHVGANTGQERDLYNLYNLDVIWIEPIPDVFETLNKNILQFPKQKAYQYLITDENDKSYQFNITDNHGASSSILEFKQHEDIWPEVKVKKKINLTSITLSRFIEKENIDLSIFDTLVMDTQGSELLVLKGAENILNKFHFIMTEAADFEAYENCCQLVNLDIFLQNKDFKQVSKTSFAKRDKGGAYYNVTYMNASVNKRLSLVWRTISSKF